MQPNGKRVNYPGLSSGNANPLSATSETSPPGRYRSESWVPGSTRGDPVGAAPHPRVVQPGFGPRFCNFDRIMPKIKTEALLEGLVAAEDVRNMDDMLLFPAGTALTARHIHILQTWGVTEIAVESAGDTQEEPDPLAKLPPDVAARLTTELKGRFWEYDEGQAPQKEIFRVALRRAALHELENKS